MSACVHCIYSTVISFDAFSSKADYKVLCIYTCPPGQRECALYSSVYTVCVYSRNGWMDGWGENYWRQSEWGWTNRRFYIDAVDSIAVLPVFALFKRLSLFWCSTASYSTQLGDYTPAPARFVYKMYSVRIVSSLFCLAAFDLPSEFWWQSSHVWIVLSFSI